MLRKLLMTCLVVTTLAVGLAWLWFDRVPAWKVRAAGPLVVCAPEGLLAPEVLKAFEQETGAKVEVRPLSSEAELREDLGAGRSPCDVIVLTGASVDAFLRDNLIVPLASAAMKPPAKEGTSEPGFLQSPPYDPDLTVSLPLTWAVCGIGYREGAEGGPFNGLDTLFDPAKLAPLRGKLAMTREPREAVGVALLYLGHSPNALDTAAVEQAGSLLRSQRRFLTPGAGVNPFAALAAGDATVAYGRSTDFKRACGDSALFRFEIPEHGTLVVAWNLTVSRASARKELANRFVRYMEKSGIARNAKATGLPTPQDFTLAAKPEQADRLYWVEDVGDVVELYEAAAAGVKAPTR